MSNTPLWAAAFLVTTKLQDLQARRLSLRALGMDCLLAGFIMLVAGLGRWSTIAFLWGAVSFGRAGRVAAKIKKISKKVSVATTAEEMLAAVADRQEVN